MIDETLTMIPGPTPVHARILDALARPTTSHVFPAFVEEFRQALAGFRALCRSEAGQPFIVAGGGTLAMEIALVNLVAPGEKVLVVSHGYFGDRFGDLAASFGIEAEVMKSEWGKAVPPADVAARLAAGSYAAVTVSHVDTSTGTLAPVEAYVEILRGRPELFILDGVCATGGVDERFDEWGVDVLLTGPQKAIGAPPGLALCLFSERAMARRTGRTSVPAYYADVMRWLPVMQDPGSTSRPPASTRSSRSPRPSGCSTPRACPPASRATGGSPAPSGPGSTRSAWRSSPTPDCRADTLSVVLLPEGVADAAFRKEVASRGVVVAGGLGPIAGKAFRLGHMGNINAAEVVAALGAIEGSLAALGVAVTPGAAVAAAAPHL